MGSKIRYNSGPMLGLVGTIFRSPALLARGLHFSNPPPPEGRASRVEPRIINPYIFIHLSSCFNSCFRFNACMIPPILCSFPRARTYRRTSCAVCFWGFKMRFFCLPKFISFLACIFDRNNCENHWFWPPKTLPKSSQNAFKIDVPKNMQFFIDFCSKNALLQRLQHRFRIGFYNTFCLSGTFLQIAFRMHFWFQKLSKNSSKTTSEPFTNRCRKSIVFQHRFFRVSAFILEPLGSPSPPRCLQRQAC